MQLLKKIKNAKSIEWDIVEVQLNQQEFRLNDSTRYTNYYYRREKRTKSDRNQ
jgi:hypothetical protein